ncbi:MAG: hypothetical protein L3J31_01240 [Bacteroidales bacterium]|nr:hypothetical protein [Bacteroidales bacterium]MCF6341414.1 hypothetical protein [Bacteroidales bacterium]
MKRDKLEQYIIENKDEFDELIPNPALWDKVETRKPKTIQLNWKTIGLRAAAVVVIFISSYYFHDFVQNRYSRQNKLASEVENNRQNPMYQELMEAEFYYTSQIDETKAAVFQLTSNNHRLRNEINAELLDLDKVFRELKNDLNDNADNEEVIVAMIQNYRIKLEILKDILYQLKSTDNKNKNDEAIQLSS